MKFLIVSPFKQPGGYATLCEGFALDLVSAGHQVTVIGVGHDAREHYYPFSLNPALPVFVPQMLQKLEYELRPDCLCFLGDIPNQLAIFDNLNKHFPGWTQTKTIVSFFPIESDPLYDDWAKKIRANTRMAFTYTEFGIDTAKVAGLSLHRLPFCLDDFWYEDLTTEEEIRSLDGRYVLTVAANQHRKNIPSGMKMMKPLMDKEEDLRYVLVTDIDKADGWDLRVEAKKVGMPVNRFIVLSSLGISNEGLKRLYSSASAFLLTSVAEGIGIPLYEAASQGCPLVATNCCSMTEVMKLTDGFPIAVAHVEPYPWGNINHYFPSTEDGTSQISKALVSTSKKKLRLPSRQSATNKFLKLLELFQEAMRVKEAQKEDGKFDEQSSSKLGINAASEILN